MANPENGGFDAPASGSVEEVASGDLADYAVSQDGEAGEGVPDTQLARLGSAAAEAAATVFAVGAFCATFAIVNVLDGFKFNRSEAKKAKDEITQKYNAGKISAADAAAATRAVNDNTVDTDHLTHENLSGTAEDT